MTWTVLPSPMSSARQAPSPSRAANRSQEYPTFWYGRRVALRPVGAFSSRVSGDRKSARIASRSDPAVSPDHSRIAASSSTPTSFFVSDTPESSRIPSKNEIPSWRTSFSTCFQCSRAAWSFSRSTSTHFPLSGIRPPLDSSSSAISSPLRVSPSRLTPTENFSIASAVRLALVLESTLTLTRGRVGVFALHQSGTRTIKPLDSSSGIVWRKRCASRGVQASG